jgi:hypothetical protein
VGITAASNFVIKGNTATPGNVIISVTSNHCFTARSGGIGTVQDMELRTTTSGSGLRSQDGSLIEYSNIRFGTCAQFHVTSVTSGRITATGAYSIVGNAQIHAYATGGVIGMAGLSITLTGTPAFSSAFASAERNGLLNINSNTYTGSATGTRYSAQTGGGIFSGGGVATYLPGNASGTATSPGWYS